MCAQKAEGLFRKEKEKTLWLFYSPCEDDLQGTYTYMALHTNVHMFMIGGRKEAQSQQKTRMTASRREKEEKKNQGNWRARSKKISNHACTPAWSLVPSSSTSCSALVFSLFSLSLCFLSLTFFCSFFLLRVPRCWSERVLNEDNSN